MSGIEFRRLCDRDAAPCAGIIREQLKGWPERVLDPAALKQGRLEYAVCPPHRPDAELAALFVDGSKDLRLTGMSLQEAIETVFTNNNPACASSRDS